MSDLKAPFGPLAYFLDLDPPASDFLADVKEGLSKDQKALSPMYFYDQRGSALFEQITKLAEYYPTRTEQQLLHQNAVSIGKAIGHGVNIVEYGSGASEKIRRLIGVLDAPSSYVAMDISRDHLIANANSLANDIALPVGAICADFNTEIELPAGILPPARTLGYFPGSTLGNLTGGAAATFFNNANHTLGDNAQLLIGIDLEKEKSILHAAYDDRDGITARFNENILHRIKNELRADIDIAAFVHEARVEFDPQRVEMHLVATRDTEITIDNISYQFARGESIHTENSIKFSRHRLEAIAGSTAWHVKNWWTDEQGWFAKCLLSNS